ncbi:ABC transporter permease [Blastopirellula marina]|uniref:ABC transporter substrate-binding protein n=1 Tax=Blastopirellula marina TaxID=124 RepID=A0A2S8GBW7_9BACT|nr:ABC transporter permease [Blastopirellula marina]PQO41952.1 ABC transporter substrate-binding protein [Blastopirellula marina]PTL46309.1 ABC transporter permease [Blastopirellula marina]
MRFRLLPWEYAIRNLFRRPLRTFLTFVGLSTVIVLVLIVVGFIRGLERSLAVSGDPQTAIVFSLGMGENLEYSAIPMRTSDLVAASVPGIEQQFDQKYVSPELYLGTEVTLEGRSPEMGLVRGVTRPAVQVRQTMEIESGDWPKAGEILVGKMVATKLGLNRSHLGVGQALRFEGREWRISGVFSAAGSAFESEIWCRLDELQQALKRQDLSIVSLTMAPDGDFTELDLFCKERLDLELQAMRETDYYASLQKDYGPIRWLAWFVVLLVSGAGVFAGLNTMYGSVVGRIPELSTLQTIGFVRRAIVIGLIQEGMLLSAAASLLATTFALTFINGAAVRFTMGAFALQIDSVAVLIGCGVGLSLGFFGAIPPAIRALRMPIVDGLKAV